jgi:hypothetical protein
MAAQTRTITETVDIYDPETGRFSEITQTRQQVIVVGLHCQQCGTTDYESLTTGDDGYTACCNEIAMIDCSPRDCSHD